jgi:maleylacetate reductase
MFSEAAAHRPTQVTEQALSIITERRADCVVCLGGGSAIGLGKALAHRTGVDQVCIPTTYAGSEMTPILGETSDGRKATIRSQKVLPEVVIYDVQLTMGLPAPMSAASGMNAMAYAAEESHHFHDG